MHRVRRTKKVKSVHPPSLSWAWRFIIFIATAGCFSFLFYVVFGAPPLYHKHLPYYLQTKSLLHGELAVATTFSRYLLDWALTDSGWHQIWGLGVPLLRLPLHFAATFFGLPTFPDVLSFLLLSVLCVVSLFSALRYHLLFPSPQLTFAVSFFCALCVVVSPAALHLLWHWNVYKEAILFTSMWSLLVLSLLLIPPAYVKASHWWWLTLLCSFHAFLRPTGLAYGLPALLLAYVTWNHLPPRTRIVGILLFLISISGVLLLNALRFGSALDFGHGMNLPPFPGMALAKRFDLALPQGTFFEALRETLFNVFFSRQSGGIGSYWDAVHPWQADVSKWRHLLYGLFGVADLCAVGIASLLLCIPAIRRRLPLPAALTALCAFALLLLFYSRLQVSFWRYFADFIPAVQTAWLMLCLTLFHALRKYTRLAPRFAASLCVVFFALSQLPNWWSFYHTAGSKKPTADILNLSEFEALIKNPYPTPNVEAPAHYTCSAATRQFDIPANLAGWDYQKSCSVTNFSVFLLASSPCVRLSVHTDLPTDLWLDSLRIKSNRITLTQTAHCSKDTSHTLDFCTDESLTDVGFRQVVALWKDALFFEYNKTGPRLFLQSIKNIPLNSAAACN